MRRAGAPARTLLLLVLLLAALLGGPPGAAAQSEPAPPAAGAPATPTPAPAASPAPPTGQALLEFVRPIVGFLTERIFEGVLAGLLRSVDGMLHGAIGELKASRYNFIVWTPPVLSYDSPTVGALAGAMRAVANAALALVAAWGGLNLIVRPRIGAPYHGVMELLPRLVLGALLVNTSGWWTRLAIDANNALITAVGQADLPAWERADPASPLIVGLMSVLVYLVGALLLVLQQLMRLALVDVLLVVAPIGMLCWVLPQTHGYARLWASTFVGTVFTQFVQVLALKLGGSLVAEIGPVAADPHRVPLLLSVAVIVLTLKIPALLQVSLGDGLGFARYYAWRSAARALDGPRNDAPRSSPAGFQPPLPGFGRAGR
jgi:hypothetical protein